MSEKPDRCSYLDANIPPANKLGASPWLLVTRMCTEKQRGGCALGGNANPGQSRLQLLGCHHLALAGVAEVSLGLVGGTGEKWGKEVVVETTPILMRAPGLGTGQDFVARKRRSR